MTRREDIAICSSNGSTKSNFTGLTKTFSQPDILEKIVHAMEDVAVHREGLMTWSNREQLEEHLTGIDNIGLLIDRPMSPTSDIEELAQKSKYWKSSHHHWALMLMVIENIHMKHHAAKEADAEGEEETEEEVVEDDDDENALAGKDMQDMRGALRDNFTYINELTIFVNSTLDNSPVANKHYTSVKSLFERIVDAWEFFKETVGRVSEFLGINLVFVIWLSIMKKAPLLGVVTRFIGTIVAFLAILIFAIVIPIWRILQNPIDRFVKFITKLLKITPPVEEEEI